MTGLTARIPNIDLNYFTKSTSTLLAGKIRSGEDS